MFQRGLAILLSICMLTGGICDTAYAMNPQPDVGTVSAVQSVSDTSEISELSMESAAGNPTGEEGDKSEEDPAGNGDNSGNSGDGTESNDAGNGTSDDGAAGDKVDNGSGTAEDGAGNEGGTTGDSAGNEGGTTGDSAGNEGGTTGDSAGNEGGAAGDGADNEGSTPEDGTGSEDDTTGDGTGSESDAGQNDDDDTPGSEGGSGDDVAVSEDDDETDAEDQSESDADTVTADTKDSVSARSVKEEELVLTVDAPQTVTLTGQEKQWLSFTAPQDGLFRFYSTVEDDSYQSKHVYLFHEKSDNEYDYFDQDYASGLNGNFNCVYRMQSGETVYLLVEAGSSSTSSTFMVNAEKVEASGLTVTKNSEGNYTLQSDSYRLNLVMTPSFSKVKTAMQLQQADGSALTGSDSYRIYYQYSYDNSWGDKSSSYNTIYLSYSGHQGDDEITGIATGGEFLITELQIRDSSNNILAVLGADQQAISVNTIATEKQGILTQVTAEDTSISIKTEMMSNKNGRLRYRKKDEIEWSYYKDTIYYYTNEVTLPAEADTDYVVELTGMDMETVYDTAEVRTKAFAATDINAEVMNITSSGAMVKVTIGTYTGANRYIHARVSYIDSMGDSKTSTGYVYASNIASGSINLPLSNLTAGTEYKDLEVELDDTDSYSMEYAAHRIKVSFTTAASALTADQINVTVTPDAGDGTKAVLNVALQGITEGSYQYTAKYRVAGSKDWQGSSSSSGSLASDNSYADEKNLSSLIGDTEYEVLVMVDGVSKAASFTTTAAAVAAKVEVKPLMQGVQVAAALTGTETLSGTYSISVQYYDQDVCGWMSAYAVDYTAASLTADKNWESTAVFYSDKIRPNAENDWKISISGDSVGKVYEKFFSLTAVRQEVSLTAEDVMCTTARIRAVLAARDESIRYKSANLYYREKGATQWSGGDSCSYTYENGSTVYLSGLKEDTEYEVKLVPDKYPEEVLGQTTFRTLKDTRSLSVSVDNCRYTSAQVNWTFDSGANVLSNSSYICIYYREKDAATWNFLNSTWRSTTYIGKEFLTDLDAGTSYEVLVELKDTSSDAAGQNVVRDVKAEFTTVAVDHVLEANLAGQETEATSVTFDMQLKKPTGALAGRAKAVVQLIPADGSSVQSKAVYFSKDNQYKAKLKMSGLIPSTRYAVYAELYESENNAWSYLKEFNFDDVTTATAAAATSLAISEQEFVLNKGMFKKLTVTAQPQEAAAGLKWSSSDETVATVSSGGIVTALKAGEADITASAAGTAAGGDKSVSAVSHVTVQDYTIRVKNADGSYGSIPNILSKSQKRTFVVYDNTAGQDLSGVAWSSSNTNAARITGEGLLEPQNYGQTYVTAKTKDGIILKNGPLTVVNEIQGFSITRPETDNDSYRALKAAEAKYQVAAGETYRVGCVLSPAYTDQYSSSVSMEADRFDWSADNSAVTVKVSEYDTDLTEIMIPESVSGTVKVSAVMKDEEYKNKSFTITLDVLRKPEVVLLPATYTWLDYSNKLRDAGLPENWKWKEPDTLIYEAGMKTFTARYTQSGYYPYETGVVLYAEKIGNNLSVAGNYSTGKKAYIVKKETPLKVSISALGGSIPALLYDQAALTPAAKDAAKVSVSEPDEAGYYSVTASVKGTYTVSAAVSLKKAAFEKTNGAYVLAAGENVKNTTASVKFMAVDSAPVKKISFAVAEDSPEKVVLTEDGTIEYEITAANADTKANERVIYLNVTATDTDGNEVANPDINYTVSDTAVVKTKKDGTNRLILTIPKEADGLAKIVAAAKDELGYSTQFAVRVKDYTPRVTTYKTTVNENYTYGTEIAQMVLPYCEENNNQIEELLLVETDSKNGKDTVPGLDVVADNMYGSYKYSLSLQVKDKEQIKKKGNLNYYLAIVTQAYGGMVFVPVQIKIEEGMPAVSLRQTGKVNVFYTDTTHLSNYDAVSMGLVDVSSAASIESVRWVAGEGAESGMNTEFVIERYSTYVVKNGKYTKKYMIQQHKPVLNNSKKPSDAAVKGNIFIRLSGYKEEIKMPLTIQTVYKKPVLKMAGDYKVCPALGQKNIFMPVYTNAAKSNYYMIQGNTSVWRGYADVTCADMEIEVEAHTDSIMLRYNGTKDKKTQFRLDSDYWYEPLMVPVKVKVLNSKVKISPGTVILNTAYPSETTQTSASAQIYTAGSGYNVFLSDISMEGTNSKAQELLDKELLNIYMDKANGYTDLAVSLNYAKAMGSSPIKPGSYKFKLTPYYGDMELNSVTLTVKVIDKEATVNVKAKGTIDLLKLNYYGDDYEAYSNNSIVVTPTFKNLDSSYDVIGAELEGAYKDLFEIRDYYSHGVLRIVPSSFGKLKAGKSYQLSVAYTVKDVYGEGGETITVRSNTFTVKPKQSVPKVTSSVKQLALYACAEGENKAERMYLYVPHNNKKGYYAIQGASGSLDVNKDGRADLMVKTLSTDKSSGRAQIAVYVLDADAVKATTKGVAYKIPVTVRCVGRDGVSKDASATVSVVVKK